MSNLLLRFQSRKHACCYSDMLLVIEVLKPGRVAGRNVTPSFSEETLPGVPRGGGGGAGKGRPAGQPSVLC